MLVGRQSVGQFQNTRGRHSRVQILPNHRYSAKRQIGSMAKVFRRFQSCRNSGLRCTEEASESQP